jgi:predicted nucleic acid-binding protein
MKSVLDASVAVKWVLVESNTDKARHLRDASRQGQHELIAPDWFLTEVTNILGKAAARKMITAAEARQGYSEIVADMPNLHPTLPLLNVAFDLALQHQRAVYDCLYVALALQEKCQLITADESLVRQLQPVYGCLVSLSSLP